MPRPISAQSRNEQLLMEKATRQLYSAQEPVEKIRLLCLQRGTMGIMNLGKQFRIIDDDRSGDLSFEEFRKGLKELGFDGEESEISEIFKLFDQDESGTIKYEEFLEHLRPPMNQMRIALIEKAYAKLDKNGDGEITIEDLQDVYNFKYHPDFLNGNKTEQKLSEEMIRKFENSNSIDGKLTKQEFLDYYSGVSASIDDDMYFDLMMRQAWKL
ncbi:Calcyphosin-like protein [Sarcoptes scabiei]|uniref:Calcyphosin-like protein n=1 Tax=Sarcoptes scabiei TaxID=52283 RepID=A0A132AG98_SARSC|nr:Calcyphosin-like protein [Sarcoptes scabiei]KPM09470.1 calcyphosin-like protein [Sarcoptes scabiei]UXI18245.1 testis-specific serine/threonine-protein kinase 1-like [Sarcoptes scabiei]